MPQLHVSNGFTKEILGLGRYQGFSALSEKRVTKSVRAELRAKYGHDSVKVSCSAEFAEACWIGQCWIGCDEAPLKYRISAG